MTQEQHQEWQDSRKFESTWTPEQWQHEIAHQRVLISFYEPFELPFAVRLSRDGSSTSQCTAQGRSLAEALRSLADWVEMNTKGSEL